MFEELAAAEECVYCKGLDLQLPRTHFEQMVRVLERCSNVLEGSYECSISDLEI